MISLSHFLEVEYGCEDFSELRACSIFAESPSVFWFILFSKFSWTCSDSKFGLFNIAIWLKDSGVLFSCDSVANRCISSYLFWSGVKIWLFVISSDWFWHKVLSYKVEYWFFSKYYILYGIVKWRFNLWAIVILISYNNIYIILIE